MTSRELEMTRYVYSAIARLLPSQGRDYTVDISFDPSGHPIVRVKGLTKYGETFADHCIANLQSAITELVKDHGGK